MARHIVCISILLSMAACAPTTTDLSAPHYRDDRDLDPAPGEIRVLTWNIWLVPTSIDRAERFQAIVARLDDYDIIALQEAWGAWSDGLAEALAAKGYTVIRPEACSNSSNPGDSGLLLITRWPVAASHSESFRDRAGEEGLVGKGFLYARIMVEEQGIDVITTHTQADPALFFLPPFGTGPGTREKQMEQLRTFLETLRAKDPDSPRLVMGDFNIDGPLRGDRIGYDEYDRMLQTLSLPGGDALDLHVSRMPRMATPDDKNATEREPHLTYDYRHYPLARVFTHLFLGPGHGQRLDYMISISQDPDKHIEPSDLVVRHFTYVRSDGTLCPLSDHAGLEAALDWP